MRRAPSSARRKCVPSRSMSVVTSSGVGTVRSTAQSSPGPTRTRESGAVRCLSQLMYANSFIEFLVRR